MSYWLESVTRWRGAVDHAKALAFLELLGNDHAERLEQSAAKKSFSVSHKDNQMKEELPTLSLFHSTKGAFRVYTS